MKRSGDPNNRVDWGLEMEKIREFGGFEGWMKPLW